MAERRKYHHLCHHGTLLQIYRTERLNIQNSVQVCLLILRVGDLYSKCTELDIKMVKFLCTRV
jgi:hypothetical protein